MNPSIFFRPSSLFQYLSNLVHRKIIYPSYDGWTRGFPIEEVAFVNRLTEKLSYSNIYADPIIGGFVSWSIFGLHRKNGNKDAFECDLAVSFFLEQDGAQKAHSKTAFFQIKKGRHSEALKQVTKLKNMNRPEVFDNAFVLSLDFPPHPKLSILSFAEVGRLAPSPLSSEIWLPQWFECKHGKPDPDGKFIEILSTYILNQEEAWLSPDAWILVSVSRPQIGTFSSPE